MTNIHFRWIAYLWLIVAVSILTLPTQARAADHPFLIVSEAELPSVAARIRSDRWRPLWNAAADKWNTDFSGSNWQDMSRQLSYLMMMWVGDPVNAQTYENKIVSVINRWSSLMSSLGPDHNDTVGPSSSVFNSILALDLIYNRLSNEQRSTAQDHLQRVVDWFRQNTRNPWELSRWGVLTLWAVYTENAQDLTTYLEGYNNYLLRASMMEDGSWNQSPGYLSARIGANRLAKSHTIDVLQYNSKFNYYQNRQMRDFIEWMGSFAFTPFGGNTRFGDTGSIRSSNIASDNLLFRTNRYGSRLGGIGMWLLNRRFVESYGAPMPWTRDHSNFLTLVMMPDQPPAPVMPKSLLKELSGAALWDRTDSSDALSGVLYSLVQENDHTRGYGHAHQDVNSIDLVAYGEHMIANSGTDYVGRDGQGFDWPGYTPENGRWYHAYMQNSVLIGNRTDHVKNEGAGLIDGVVGGAVEFGRTGSLDALDNGEHRRTLFLIHPVSGTSHGYFSIVDEVTADTAGDMMKMNLHPNSESGVRVVRDREQYSADIDGFNQFDHDGSERISIFYGTRPASVSIKKAYKGDFQFDAIKTDYLEASFPTDSQGMARAVTVLFPSDQSHQPPPLSRITGSGYSGVLITHDNDAKDTLLATHRNGTVAHEDVTIRGKAAFFRRNSANLIASYAMSAGYQFEATSPAPVGFSSANEVSLQMGGLTGHIQTAGGEINFITPGITGVNYDGRVAEVVSRSSGRVRVRLPQGRFQLELTRNPVDPPTDPQVSILDTTVTEDQGVGSVTVKLSEQPTSPVRVLLATAPDSARNGLDFYGQTTELIIAVGEIEKTLNVELIDDSEIEQQESFYVRIISSDGADISRRVGVVTIRDDDSNTTPFLSINSIRIDEGVGRARVKVSLEPAASTIVRVSVATRAQSAEQAKDYYGLYEVLSFAAGQQSAFVDLDILDDTVTEGDETLTMRLFAADGARIQQDKQIAVITIGDND